MAFKTHSLREVSLIFKSFQNNPPLGEVLNVLLFECCGWNGPIPWSPLLSDFSQFDHMNLYSLE